MARNELTHWGIALSIKALPKTFNFANFPWVAVPRDSVDENYIFGGGDNNHEVM